MDAIAATDWLTDAKDRESDDTSHAKALVQAALPESVRRLLQLASGFRDRIEGAIEAAPDDNSLSDAEKLDLIVDILGGTEAIKRAAESGRVVSWDSRRKPAG